MDNITKACMGLLVILFKYTGDYGENKHTKSF